MALAEIGPAQSAGTSTSEPSIKTISSTHYTILLVSKCQKDKPEAKVVDFKIKHVLMGYY